MEDGSDFDGISKGSRETFFDPYVKVDGGMASTEPFTLWKTIMPGFADITRLEYFRTEISQGRKQYKDFYIHIK